METTQMRFAVPSEAHAWLRANGFTLNWAIGRWYDAADRAMEVQRWALGSYRIVEVKS